MGMGSGEWEAGKGRQLTNDIAGVVFGPGACAAPCVCVCRNLKYFPFCC